MNHERNQLASFFLYRTNTVERRSSLEERENLAHHAQLFSSVLPETAIPVFRGHLHQAITAVPTRFVRRWRQTHRLQHVSEPLVVNEAHVGIDELRASRLGRRFLQIAIIAVAARREKPIGAARGDHRHLDRIMRHRPRLLRPLHEAVIQNRSTIRIHERIEFRHEVDEDIFEETLVRCENDLVFRRIDIRLVRHVLVPITHEIRKRLAYVHRDDPTRVTRHRRHDHVVHQLPEPLLRHRIDPE